MRTMVLLLLAAGLTAQQSPDPERYVPERSVATIMPSQAEELLQKEAITATFAWQASRLSGLQLYAANVCNVKQVSATVQAIRDVWPKAEALLLHIQTPTAIRVAEKAVEKTSVRAWTTYLLGGACGIAAAMTNSGVVASNPDKRLGKVVAYGTAACAVALPVWASTMSKVPGGEMEVPYADLLPGVFVLGGEDCKQYLIYVADGARQGGKP